MRPLRRTRAAVAAVLGALGALALGAPGPAVASHRQLALFATGGQVLGDPAGTLAELRSLGVGVVRLTLDWNAVAPTSRPRGFRADDPAAYSASAWRPYDAVVQDAARDGIAVDFVLSGGAPSWAIGRGAPRGNRFAAVWRPSPSGFGAFVRAVGRRYSGAFRPCAPCAPLPAVRFWELWNEPNFGQDLAPQAVDGSRRSTSPAMYRALVAAAWPALQATGHSRDTIVIGGLSSRGFQAPAGRRWPEGLPGDFSTTKPMLFLRALYCVDTRYRPLRGAAARDLGCPTSASGRALFARRNPGLFTASGFGIHPYPLNLPPTRADSTDPNYVEFSEIPRLEHALDRAARAYGSRRRAAIYDTEFGYITNPPNHSNHFVSPRRAAEYINWAEYLSWRSPRIATTMQFLLRDPNPVAGVPEYGGFATGLEFFSGTRKPTYAAYRMPVFLPSSRLRRGQRLTVWGCVRPAHTVASPPPVAIQVRSGARGPWRTVARIAIRDPRGYFETRVPVIGSGAVRLAWSDAGVGEIYSRVAPYTLRP